MQPEQPNPYAPPQTAEPLAPMEGVHRAGKFFAMPRGWTGPVLPHLCVKCGAAAAGTYVSRHSRLGEGPALAYRINLVLCLGLFCVWRDDTRFTWHLIVLILHLAINLWLRQHARARLGLCASHRRGRLWLRIALWAGIGLQGLWWIGVAQGGAHASMAAVLGMLALAGASWHGLGERRPKLLRINKREAVLAGAHPAWLEALERESQKARSAGSV